MRYSNSLFSSHLGYLALLILAETQLDPGVVATEFPQTLGSRSISSDAAKFSKISYDYIIIGAGTAGLTLAARLSQSGKYTVGVLEAGISGYGDPIIDIPGNFGGDIGTVYDCKPPFIHVLGYI